MVQRRRARSMQLVWGACLRQPSPGLRALLLRLWGGNDRGNAARHESGDPGLAVPALGFSRWGLLHSLRACPNLHPVELPPAFLTSLRASGKIARWRG